MNKKEKLINYKEIEKMNLFAIYSVQVAKKLIQAGYELDHVAPNKKERYEGFTVFYFIDDGNIKNFI